MQTSPNNCSRETQKQKHLSYFFNLFVLDFFFHPFFKFHSFYLSAERQTEQHEAHFTVGLTGNWNSLNRNPNSKTLADLEDMWNFSSELWSQISRFWTKTHYNEKIRKWDSRIIWRKAWTGSSFFVYLLVFWPLLRSGCWIGNNCKPTWNSSLKQNKTKPGPGCCVSDYTIKWIVQTHNWQNCWYILWNWCCVETFLKKKKP